MATLTTLLISSFPPFPTLTLSLPSSTHLSDLPSFLPSSFPSFDDSTDLAFSLPCGLLPSSPDTCLDDLSLPCQEDGDEDVSRLNKNSRLLSIRITPRLRGGKGGFGSQLRAAGGRMSSQKTSNNDSCRDLNGRRLSTIKKAKALESYLDSEPERQKAQKEAQKAKLAALERKLGISGGKSTADAGPSSGQKRRFDDTEYLEQSQEIVENVKSAVMAGLKKKKKTKTTESPEAEDHKKKSESPSTTPDETLKTKDGLVLAPALTEKILESPSAAIVTATVAASLATVGA